MNIIIPIKQVPETSNVKMDEETGTMVREGVERLQELNCFKFCFDYKEFKYISEFYKDKGKRKEKKGITS